MGWSDGAPPTPRFNDRLEAELRSRAAGVRRRRLPIPSAAIRALREFSGYAVHAALAVGLTVALLLVVPGPFGSPSPPSAPPSTATSSPDQVATRHVRVDSHGHISADALAATAQARGFEVQVVTAYVTDPADHGRVLAVDHLGRRHEAVPPASVKGPVLIVVGATVTANGTIAY